MPKHPPLDRIRVIGFAGQGLSVAQIARQTGFHKNFITRWLPRHDITNLPRPGRPKSISRRTATTIVKLATGQQRRSLRTIARHPTVNRSHSSVHRILKADLPTQAQAFLERQAGGCDPQPSHLAQSLVQKRKQLDFALANRNRDWRQVVFSDETTIQTHGMPNRQNDRVWAKSSADVPPEETKKYSSYAKFWGAFGYYGKSELILCKKPWDSNEYQRVLDLGLRDFPAQFRRPWVFEQDGDSSHTSVSTKEWLARQRPPVRLLQGVPPNSPDLWPIENVWAILKDRVARRAPRSRKEMIKFAKEEWNAFDLQMLRNMVDSVPNRIERIIGAEGGSI